MKVKVRPIPKELLKQKKMENMTPKEKAEELIEDYVDFHYFTTDDKYKAAKESALILVKKILSELDEFLVDDKAGFENYFELVKEEINKL